MKDEYIKLEEAVEKFITINARSFDTDQIVYLLNKLPKYEMPEQTPPISQRSMYQAGYRQAQSDAIEAIEIVDWYHQNRNKDMVSGANDDEHQAWYKAEDVYKALEAIPSAIRGGEDE